MKEDALRHAAMSLKYTVTYFKVVFQKKITGVQGYYTEDESLN